MSGMPGAGDAVGFWEDRYRGAAPIWSGAANRTLVDVLDGLDGLGGLEPGRALDLGCGEGGDALWLAARGWTVTGVDLSPTAVARASAAADAAGIPAERVRFVAADLETWSSDGRYDLVTASFLQSPIAFPREEILRRASRMVAPGGRILVIAHAGAPHWVPADSSAHPDFPTPAGDLAALHLDPTGWEVVAAETRSRTATAPDGSTGPIDDSVVFARRTPTGA